MLKRVNYWVSSFIPQKIYWGIAGFIHPWQAVLEDTSTPEDLYKRGDDIKKLLDGFGLVNKRSEVLDIGCGVGRAEYALYPNVKRCVGIDISPTMVRLAKKNIKKPNVEFMETNGKDLSLFRNDSFSLVFSVLVFQHMPREKFISYLDESYRVLKKQGKLFFQIPLKDKHSFEPPKDHPWALRYYSTQELNKLLVQAGYRKARFYDVDGKELKGRKDQAVVIAEK